jgi:thiosulfate/3-mercaptopyruvate sulfurtransferase
MAVAAQDHDAKIAAYADPRMLVTTDWLAERLDEPGLVVVESSEDVLLYETGHIPGAVKIDWHTELNDPGHPRLHRRGRVRRADAVQGHQP